MDQDYEKLTDQITNRIKDNGDLSAYKKNRQISPLVTLLSKLNSFPKAQVPEFDSDRVRNLILNRIAAPKTEKSGFAWVSFLRIGTGIMASLMIVVSLTFATAVAALTSVPGQTIYPLKQVAENIELKLTPEAQRANLQLSFANNRVDELQQVIQQQQDGQISTQAAQQIVASTVKNLQQSTTAATQSATGAKPKAAIATKLADLSNQLRIASISTQGQVKIELQQAVDNIEQTALTAGDMTATSTDSDNSVSAQGELTAVSKTSISIGTATFLITKNTNYVNIQQSDLAIGQTVDIEGQITDNKTYVQTITLITDPTPAPTSATPPTTSGASTDNSTSNTTTTTTIPTTAPDSTPATPAVPASQSGQ